MLKVIPWTRGIIGGLAEESLHILIPEELNRLKYLADKRHKIKSRRIRPIHNRILSDTSEETLSALSLARRNMRKILAVAILLFSSTLQADPVLVLFEKKMSEYRSRNDMVMVVFKARGDVNNALSNIKAAMRTQDPMGYMNPYWIVDFPDEAVSAQTNCGVVIGQWYAGGFPFRAQWEQIMYRALQQNVEQGAYFYSFGDGRTADDESLLPETFSKIGKSCLKGKFNTQTKASEAAKTERARQIGRSMASQFDGSEGSLLAREIQDVSVKLSNIDDLGIVAIQNPEGIFILANEVERTIKNGVGTGTVALNQYLDSGTSLVILALHNKTNAFGKDNWSYEFNLLGDGTTLWREAKTKTGSGSGIKYWIAFSVEKRADGMSLIRKASESQLIKLAPDMVDFNNWLIKYRGQEEGSNASSAAAAAAALLILGGAPVIFGGGTDMGACSSDRPSRWDELITDPRDGVSRPRWQVESR